MTEGNRETEGDSGGGTARVPRHLVASNAFLIVRLGFEARRRFTQALAQVGLRPHHWAVMSVLDDAGTAAQQTLSELLGIDRSDVVDVVDLLEREGLAERRRDTEDRRRYAVGLTRKGRGILERCRALTDQVERDLLAPLDSSERSTLHTLLLRLAAHHDEHIPAD